MIKDLTVIVPTFHSKDLILIFLRSFEKFKPKDLNVKYIVVENTDDVSYKDEVLSIAENIKWINNNHGIKGKMEEIGSSQNASAIEISKQYVDTEYVFIAHCDVCICDSKFFDCMFQKISEGFRVVGPFFDRCPDRIKALHVSGLFMETKIMNEVDFFPKRIDSNSRMDVGDAVTLYCRNNSIDHYCLVSTHNKDIVAKIDDKFKDFNVVRSIDDDLNVIFMHLGRGVPKTIGTYAKTGSKRVYLEDWIEFCNKEILND